MGWWDLLSVPSFLPIAQVLVVSTGEGQSCSFKHSSNKFLTFDGFHSNRKVKLTAASAASFLP